MNQAAVTCIVYSQVRVCVCVCVFVCVCLCVCVCRTVTLGALCKKERENMMSITGGNVHKGGVADKEDF